MGDFSLPEFKYLQDCDWTWTEKLNGMNVRAILDGIIEFRGRSDRAYMPGPLMSHLRNTLDVEEVQEQANLYGEGLCLYGEGVGPGIQSGSQYGPDQFFVLFDVMTNYGWASRRDTEDIAHKLNIPIAPVIMTAPVTKAINLIERNLESKFGNFMAEGLVGRPLLDLRDRYGVRITAKIKTRDFYHGNLT